MQIRIAAIGNFAIISAFPEYRSQLPDECKRYWHIRDQLSVDDGLIVYGCRLLIPILRCVERCLPASLRESHQGSTHKKERGRLVVYWPGLDNDNR